jgi:hypothetical protein
VLVRAVGRWTDALPVEIETVVGAMRPAGGR